MLLENPDALGEITLDPNCVVVVGSGAVGLHLAVQLAMRGRQVIVLESGSDVLNNFSHTTFDVVGREHETIRRGRSVALGGTTNLWGGQLVEFNPIDFEGRDWLAGSRWPLRYDELAAHYPATYDALGYDERSQQDLKVWDDVGKPPPHFGDDLELFLTRWMHIPNLARHYQEQIDQDDNLIVVQHATVTGFDGEGETIRALRMMDERGKQHSIVGAQFVLAAGTIENARLMLHAAEDASWNCPWRENDNIGRYFQDHLGGRVAYIKPRDSKRFFDTFSTIVLKGRKFQPKLRLRNAFLESNPMLNIQIWIAFESSIKENLVFLKQFFKAAVFSRKIGSIKDLIVNTWACSRHMIPLMWNYIIEHRILIPSGSQISMTIQAETEPLADSRITIDPASRDRYGLPKVLLDWKLADGEIKRLRDFTLRVQGALDATSLADLEVNPALAAEDPKFVDTLHDTNHHAGGCVMGESMTDGVVDRDLRVFGTKNLYAAGACVFRTNSNANSTFTSMAFATRLAQHIAEESRGQNRA